MGESPSLEGWTPEVGREVSLAEVVDLAFDYRGNVTVVRCDGVRLEGYVFNRNAEVAEPYLQLLDLDGHGPITLRYAEVRTVLFTGKDAAAGKSYEAWLRRRDQDRAERATRAGSAEP